ncbi:response regulator transcription factor [Paenibacillus sp. NFR01]|uniref:response regulator transcription factor n=1 Tax=Paenibacillus sp. NFR01 TaxID=1566279 RepID=UPI0008D4A87D|nr:response regulator transcription factor [Paenibacillus sp. NFR01]SET07885.1 DNA-binding response regulator, OmpR family, contains REC and winged-helix (wHTH) domain [Paenibacillus sp. NFR01]
MKRTVLIVEDELSIAELQRDYLEMDGFQTEIAENGELGLELALSGRFDLIVLDVMLPKLSGFDLCKIVRKELDIPILMVTARKEDIDLVRGLGLGADDYITKPFKPAELVARIKAHISRYDRLKGRGNNTNELEVRDLRLNMDSRRAYVRDSEVVLTTKEFDLLYFLAQHPNHVFSKDLLFERVWGIDSLGDAQTVTVHIRKLREKIEENSANPVYIETVWGSGYRFRA